MNDPATTVAFLGFLGTLVTASIGGVIAVLLHRKETQATAENTLEKTLRERIALRDEQLADLRQDLTEAIADRDQYKSMVDDMRRGREEIQ